MSHGFSKEASTCRIEGSPHIGLHDPAYPLRQAPLAELMPCLMRAATLPKAIRAVVEVLLVDRCQPHRHRSLDSLVLERWRTDRALALLVLLDPDALYGHCLRASTA